MSELVLTGLDGSNPLAFLAALGTLRTLTMAWPDCDVPWLRRNPKMAWSVSAGSWSPVLHLTDCVDEAPFTRFLMDHLEQDINQHPVAFMAHLRDAGMAEIREVFRDRQEQSGADDRDKLDWCSAMCSDLAPGATSRLQTVRRDYFFGNMKSIMLLTTTDHLLRSLFRPWDYRDALDNQSLHLEPSEDRRHAYQWHKPSGDPTRKRRGGMLGANRLAIEAFPLLQSVASGEKLVTRGFSGTRSDDTRWTWPIWTCPIGMDTILSLLALSTLQAERPDASELHARGIALAMRSARILVEKTPNFTPAQPV